MYSPLHNIIIQIVDLNSPVMRAGHRVNIAGLAASPTRGRAAVAPLKATTGIQGYHSSYFLILTPASQGLYSRPVMTLGLTGIR